MRRGTPLLAEREKPLARRCRRCAQRQCRYCGRYQPQGLRRINGVGNPREFVLWVANGGSLLLQTSFLEWMAYQQENAACAIVISILCYEYYNIFYACLGNANSGLESQTFGPSTCKRYRPPRRLPTVACCSPQNVVNMDHPFRSRKWKPSATTRHPIKCQDETGAGLDFVDQASVVIADVIDSATDRSRN